MIEKYLEQLENDNQKLLFLRTYITFLLFNDMDKYYMNITIPTRFLVLKHRLLKDFKSYLETSNIQLKRFQKDLFLLLTKSSVEDIKKVGYTFFYFLKDVVADELAGIDEKYIMRFSKWFIGYMVDFMYNPFCRAGGFTFRASYYADEIPDDSLKMVEIYSEKETKYKNYFQNLLYIRLKIRKAFKEIYEEMKQKEDKQKQKIEKDIPIDEYFSFSIEKDALNEKIKSYIDYLTIDINPKDLIIEKNENEYRFYIHPENYEIVLLIFYSRLRKYINEPLLINRSFLKIMKNQMNVLLANIGLKLKFEGIIQHKKDNIVFKNFFASFLVIMYLYDYYSENNEFEDIDLTYENLFNIVYSRFVPSKNKRQFPKRFYEFITSILLVFYQRIFNITSLVRLEFVEFFPLLLKLVNPNAKINYELFNNFEKVDKGTEKNMDEDKNENFDEKIFKDIDDYDEDINENVKIFDSS